MASKNSMGRRNPTSMVPSTAFHRLEMLLETRGKRPEEAGLHSLLEAGLPSRPWRKEPWTRSRDICLLLLTLHRPTVITPHPRNTEQIRKKHLDRHVPPFACTKIKILPTKYALCVLINHASAGFLGVFPLEHITTPLHLQRARVVLKP